MLRLIIMAISTFFIFLIIAGAIKSKKYAVIVDSMPESFLRNMYGIGLAVSDFKIFGFKKKIIKKLKTKTLLIYGEKYAEFYAQIAFGKAMTYTVIFFGVLPSFGVIIGNTAAVFFLVLAFVITAIAWNFCVLVISDEIRNREQECLSEFPDMVTKFALLINSGMVLREAWHTVADSKDNVLYELMKKSCEEMKNGTSEIDAIYEFGISTNCSEIRKFTSSMIQGMSKGNSELAVFLAEQAQEMLEHKRQILLQKGEKAAGKLLIPIGITFVGIILIIGVGAMQAMSF